MRTIVTMLVATRVMVAVLVLIVVTFINFTWIFTVPACITGDSGAPGSSASANSQDRKGVFGCWLKTDTKLTADSKEQARQQAYDEWARDSERQDEIDRARFEREDERQRELARSARWHHR